MLRKQRNVVYRAWANCCEDDGGWFGWLVVAVLLAVFAALVGLLGGCAGVRPAVSLEADRVLLDGAVADVAVVAGAAAQGGEHPVTAAKLEAAGKSLAALRDGPIGRPDSPAVVPAEVVDAIHREFAGLPPSDDPAEVARLNTALAEAEAKRRAAEDDARTWHETAQAFGAKIEDAGRKIAGLTAEVADRYGLGTVATGGGGLLVTLLGLAWRHRRTAAALVKSVAITEEVRERAACCPACGAKVAAAIDAGEVVARVGAGHEAELGRAYRRATRKPPKVRKKPGRIRKATAALLGRDGDHPTDS